MAAESKFTPRVRQALVERVSVGVSLPNAARSMNVGSRTVKGWMQRGREAGDGDFFDFAVAIDRARATARERASRPLTEGQVRRHLEDAIRGGSLRALEVWLRHFGREELEPADPSGLDSLDAEAGPA